MQMEYNISMGERLGNHVAAEGLFLTESDDE